MRILSLISFFFLNMIFILPSVSFASVVSEKGTGEQNILVIMARFPDIEPSFSKEEMKEKYFVKLDRYLQSVSYRKARIKGKITDWYVLPRKVDSYRLSQHNLEVEKEKVTKLIQDAVNLADKDEDFSQYSMVFISLGAKKQR